MGMTIRHAFTIVAVVATAALSAEATPMILLTSPQAKCMSVEAPADALLHIEYEAPDLVMAADINREGANIDPRSFRKFRTTITVAQSVERENHHGDRNANDNRKYDKRAQQERIVKDLETKRGSLEYITKQDGAVLICVQSMTASAKTPTPISLRVTELPAGEESTDTPPSPEKSAADAALEQLDAQSQQKAKEHFSQMEKTLQNLISKTDMILRQADYAKELEVEFHEQSIAMNKASQWWPIVQLCVLLVTGFTQANHMVAFFRKHHIF
jgi:hypothetical protein